MTIEGRPPRWFGGFALLLGAAFVAVGIVIVRDEDQSLALFGATFVVLGLAAIGMGGYLLGLRLPLGGLMRSRPREIVGDDGTLWTAFQRPPGARLWNVIGPLIGAAFSLLFIALVAVSGDPEALPFGLVGGLMLVLMGIGAARGLRGLLRAEDALRVGARGLWLPSLGVIPWDDIAAVRSDDAAAALTSMHPEEMRPMNQQRRLAIRLRPGVSVSGGSAVERAFVDVTAAVSPRGAELTVFEYELGVPVADAMARIERYRPREEASRPAAESGGGPETLT